MWVFLTRDFSSLLNALNIFPNIKEWLILGSHQNWEESSKIPYIPFAILHNI